MKIYDVLTIILCMCLFGALPATAHDCCHHGYHCDDYSDCNGNCGPNGQSYGHYRSSAPPSRAAELQTAEGKITEIVYLPGATPSSSMVEIHLQTAGESQLIRLAPVGFLKQSGLLLREGDTITVKGFPVAGMEGDLLVASEVHKGDKVLSLRDTLGRPAW